MALAVALVVLVLLLAGARGRRKRSTYRADTASAIAAGARSWDGPTRWRGKPSTRSPRRAAFPLCRGCGAVGHQLWECSSLPARTLDRWRR